MLHLHKHLSIFLLGNLPNDNVKFSNRRFEVLTKARAHRRKYSILYHDMENISCQSSEILQFDHFVQHGIIVKHPNVLFWGDVFVAAAIVASYKKLKNSQVTRGARTCIFSEQKKSFLHDLRAPNPGEGLCIWLLNFLSVYASLRLDS